MARGRGSSPRDRRGQKRRAARYSAGELFAAGIGALLLVLVAGIVITSLFG